MNCSECGVNLEPSEEQVNATVDGVLQASLKDAEQHGGVCLLCGHAKDVPYTRRTPVLFLLLMGCLLVGLALATTFESSRLTQRRSVAREALNHINANAAALQTLGQPIRMGREIQGEVKKDETGWQEARLTIPLHGAQADGVARVAAGRMSGPWKFTTFEIVIEKIHKKVDLISGRVATLDENAYAETHLLPATAPEFTGVETPAPTLDATYPCVFGSVANDAAVTTQLGSCALGAAPRAPVDRMEADLRYGGFVLRETDLYLDDVFQVPLTRTYNSLDWIHPNRVHAFGKSTNHPYDIAPLGTRNPYTYQMIALEDSDFIFFDRISQGSGYADAAFLHSESATRFYKATQQWNGNGWTTKLADGSEIIFPESYGAANMAQGAPTEMRNAKGDRLELIRNGRRDLMEIRTPHGHWIKFQYDGMSRIIAATDDAGHWAKYAYTADGMLETVVLSTGKERHFAYDGDLMTEIKDERGQTLVTNSYAHKELVEQQFADGSRYAYAYERSPDRTYVTVAHVTLPDHSTQDVAMEKFIPKFLAKKN